MVFSKRGKVSHPVRYREVSVKRIACRLEGITKVSQCGQSHLPTFFVAAIDGDTVFGIVPMVTGSVGRIFTFEAVDAGIEAFDEANGELFRFGFPGSGEQFINQATILAIFHDISPERART
jgi:hypothetical protein